MKRFLIIICVASILIGCTYSLSPADKEIEKEIKKSIYSERFIDAYVGGGLYVLIDRETRVQYLRIHDGYKGYMSVLVDSTGNPLLYKGELPE